MASDSPLKIMSWNVNSVNARLERLLALLSKHSPDVMCLQELKCQNEKFPESAIRSLGYHCTILGQKTYNGVALLSKMATSEIRIPSKSSILGTESRLLGIRFGKMWIYSVYVPNGQDVESSKYLYKLTWLEHLNEYLRTQHTDEDGVIVCGDFNVAQDDLDVHDPAAWEGKVLYTEKERGALKKIMADRYVDTFRLFHNAERHYSWWDNRALGFPLNHGLRIDLVLASSSMAERCIESGIERDERKGAKPSDHAPVFAVFKCV